MREPIEIKIDMLNMPHNVYYPDSVERYVMQKLQEAGVPVHGGLTPRVDFTQGTLESVYGFYDNVKTFTWRWSDGPL